MRRNIILLKFIWKEDKMETTEFNPNRYLMKILNMISSIQSRDLDKNHTYSIDAFPSGNKEMGTKSIYFISENGETIIRGHSSLGINELELAIIHAEEKLAKENIILNVSSIFYRNIHSARPIH